MNSALEVTAQHDEDERTMEKRITRKMDWHIMPWIIICECGSIVGESETVVTRQKLTSLQRTC